MAPNSNSDAVVGNTYIGTIGDTRCYTNKLTGDLTSPTSNWRLWNADMKVYRDGAGKGEEDEIFTSLDDEILAKMERRRKALIWLSVSFPLREKYLTDMGGRDKTSEDVMRRLFEKVAPPGSTYSGLEKLVVEEHMRAGMRKMRKERARRKEEEKESESV